MSNNNGIESIPYAVFAEMSKSKLKKLYRKMFWGYTHGWWRQSAHLCELKGMVKSPMAKEFFDNEKKFINEKHDALFKMSDVVSEILNIKIEEEYEMRKRIIIRIGELERKEVAK